MFPAPVDEGVLEAPSDAGGVGAEHGLHSRGKPSLKSAQIFEHPAPRPVEVSAVLENHVDEGNVEVKKAAHDLDPWGRDQSGDDRIGDLILDKGRAPAFPVRRDDDLHVREIGDGVDRRLAYGPDARAYGGE